MNLSRLLVTALVVAIGGTLLQGARMLVQQRTQTQASAQRASFFKKQLAALRSEQAIVAGELTLAEAQLASLPASSQSDATPAERARDAEIATWLVRVKHLKRLFDERPAQRIPELRLLTDADWLRAGKDLDFEDEEGVRKTLSNLRTTGKSRFQPSLNQAARKFAAANSSPPLTVLALAAYVENPTDTDILSRYELITTNRPDRTGAPKQSWALREQFAVDADYDNRFTVGPRGSGNQNGPVAWIPSFNERSQAAAEAFTAAHKGERPENPAQLIPFFSPPLDPADAARILKTTARASPTRP
jgi:hypothetical protein